MVRSVERRVFTHIELILAEDKKKREYRKNDRCGVCESVKKSLNTFTFSGGEKMDGKVGHKLFFYISFQYVSFYHLIYHFSDLINNLKLRLL